jgi:hypothetical protein
VLQIFNIWSNYESPTFGRSRGPSLACRMRDDE